MIKYIFVNYRPNLLCPRPILLKLVFEIHFPFGKISDNTNMVPFDYLITYLCRKLGPKIYWSHWADQAFWVNITLQPFEPNRPLSRQQIYVWFNFPITFCFYQSIFWNYMLYVFFFHFFLPNGVIMDNIHVPFYLM